MSILESIEAAEKAAAQTRQDASLNAREYLRNEEAQAHMEAAKRIDKAKEKAKQALLNAEAEAQKQADAYLSQKIEDYEKIANEARVKLPKAVRTIVERVVKVC